ncbi:10687_t:CDS:2, partial [Acaulospora colombiana]
MEGMLQWHTPRLIVWNTADNANGGLSSEEIMSRWVATAAAFPIIFDDAKIIVTMIIDSVM